MWCWVVWSLLVLIGLPIIAYLTARMGVIGFLRGRDAYYEKRHQDSLRRRFSNKEDGFPDLGL